jgi:hypothetical protein
MDLSVGGSMNPKAIETYLNQVASSAGINNISVSLSRQGERHAWTTASQSGEPMRFQIGCVTKAMVAATTLELEDSGELDIQSPIGLVLEEFDGTEAGEQIRICHLLSDTAGQAGFALFNKATVDTNWDQLVAELTAAPPIFTPGTVCSRDYSNQVLLGEIVRRVSGRLWMDLADEKVGMPLFGRSLYNERDRQRTWAASTASTALTVNELLSLTEVLMTGSLGSGSRCILSQRTTSRLGEVVVRSPEMAGDFTHWFPVGHGMGVPVYHSGLFGQCGVGQEQLSSIRFSAPLGIAIAVCIDAKNHLVQYDVLDAMLAELGIGMPERHDRVAMDVPLTDIEGEYIGFRRGLKVNVSVEGQRVCVTLLLRESDRPLARYFGTAHDDNTFSIDSHQSVAGLVFFNDPVSGAPSLTIGGHALRRAS